MAEGSGTRYGPQDMEGREERGPGFDDWFDEPEPPSETAGRVGRGVYDDPEDWVVPEEIRSDAAPRRDMVIGGRTVTPTQIAIVAVSFIVLLLAVLAAAGVFSSNPPAAAPSATTASPPPKVTPSTSTPTSTTPTAQAPTTTLSPGATGTQVKNLQRALTALGFSPGAADGSYGPATKIAVEKFQQSKGLAEDGVVGPETLAAIRKALSG